MEYSPFNMVIFSSNLEINAAKVMRIALKAHIDDALTNQIPCRTFQTSFSAPHLTDLFQKPA
jgi:hypothetical protein